MEFEYLAKRLDPVEFVKQRLGLTPDAQQRLVLESAARRGMLNCSRQWGKSTITAAKAVHHAYTIPASLVLVVSPSARQSGEFVRKAAGFLRRIGIRRRGDGDNATSLLLPNGSRIVGLPGEEGTIRGFSAVGLLLIDEASRVPDEMYHAVRPMLAVGGGSLWLMSTPFGKRGFFYREWASGGEGWLRVTAKATECARIRGEFLSEERRAMGERTFRQEYLCEFLDTESSLFDEELVRSAVLPGLKALKW